MLTTSPVRATRAVVTAAPSTLRAFTTSQRSRLARMTLIGRLAAEPELVSTSTGRDMVRYAVGVTGGTRDNPQTSWFRIASFDEGPRRDYLLGLPKGTLLHCDATAQMGTYEDPSDGKKKSALNLVQKSIEVLSRPKPSAESVEIEGEQNLASA